MRTHVTRTAFGTVPRRASCPDRKGNRGFTLIELLVVVAISAILVSTGVPIYKQTIATYRLDAEVNALVGDLQYARSEAIKQGTTVVMCVSINLSTSTPSCTTSNTNNNWAAGHLVATNVPSQTGTTGITIGPVLRQQWAFSGTDTANANLIGGGGTAVTAIQFNRDGFAGTPSTTSWNGFSSLASYAFVLVHPQAGSPGVGKCIAISPVGQIQIIPIHGTDNIGDVCT